MRTGKFQDLTECDDITWDPLPLPDRNPPALDAHKRGSARVPVAKMHFIVRTTVQADPPVIAECSVFLDLRAGRDCVEPPTV